MNEMNTMISGAPLRNSDEAIRMKMSVTQQDNQMDTHQKETSAPPETETFSCDTKVKRLFLTYP